MKWDKIYKEQSCVERMNAFLKGYFLLNQIYHCTGEKAKVHFDLVHIAYNACEFAVD
jgi:transposase